MKNYLWGYDYLVSKIDHAKKSFPNEEFPMMGIEWISEYDVMFCCFGELLNSKDYVVFILVHFQWIMLRIVRMELSQVGET